jgi:DNA-binding LacI/PurR family transcriptional regulator
VDFVSWDKREMGRMAVRVLADRAARGAADRMQVLIPARLEKRGSVAALGGDKT